MADLPIHDVPDDAAVDAGVEPGPVTVDGFARLKTTVADLADDDVMRRVWH
jgi:hypothetical protein